MKTNPSWTGVEKYLNGEQAFRSPTIYRLAKGPILIDASDKYAQDVDMANAIIQDKGIDNEGGDCRYDDEGNLIMDDEVDDDDISESYNTMLDEDDEIIDVQRHIVNLHY